MFGEPLPGPLMLKLTDDELDTVLRLIPRPDNREPFGRPDPRVLAG